MKLTLSLLTAAAVALVAPAAASAATLEVIGQKGCYGTGERVLLHGTGYTEGGIVDFTSDGHPIALRSGEEPIRAGGTGEVAARIKVAGRSGQQMRTYGALDRTDPTRTASVNVRVSELRVDIRPSSGRPTRRRKIIAEGFTMGSSTLWAHVLHRGSVRTFRVGPLKGACGKVSARRRLFRPGAPRGIHKIIFDTRRKYRRRSAPVQRYRWRFKIFPVRSAAQASAARLFGV
jgi:hypothetical protein